MIKSYFNQYRDLMVFRMGGEFTLAPYDPKYMQTDLTSMSLLNDPDTRKFMTEFSGYDQDAEERRKVYLVNSYMTMQMGIAFLYTLRLNAGLCCLIKVTSPSHNIVTNNFDGWLIDYITLPPFRRHKMLKTSIPHILNMMHENMGVKEVNAMVDPDNTASVNLLKSLGFSVSSDTNISKNPTTGNTPLLFKKDL